MMTIDDEERHAIARARARDAELARLREEEDRRLRARGRELVQGMTGISEDGLRNMIAKHGRALASKADEDAVRWADERFTLRRARIERAKVRLEDDEIAAVAALMRETIGEPPIDDVHARRMNAMADLRAKFAPNLPPFVETPALAAIRVTLRARADRRLEQPFVVLYGQIGVSKTSAGAHAIASMNGGAYVDARVLCDLHGSFSREDRAVVARLYEAPVLLIDELRAELLASRSLGAVLSDVLDARRGARRITIMTTNVTPKDLASSLTEQAKSRVSGQVKWVKCVGEDLRKNRKRGTR